jgi:hypothetical protein
MNSKIRIGIVSAFILAAVIPVFTQFKPEEIAQRAKWEEFLLTADIIKSEPLPEGVTKPYRLYLKKGEVENTAVWKNPDGIFNGVYDSWKHEIAAYRLDKLLELNLIPVYVERKFAQPNQKKAVPGSLSLWADHRTNLLKMAKAGEDFPTSALESSDRMKLITRVWDCLIANIDRTQQNIFVTDDWRVILIDHSRAFQSDDPFDKQLMFGVNGIFKLPDGRPFLFNDVPRAFIEKIRALDAAAIKKAVGPYLTNKEIKAIIARIPLILKEIDGTR